MNIQFTVNGRDIADDIEPRTHLADFLRERLNLTGTHLRCEQGVCGACTLLIDGQPARSCITYAGLCDGAAITTIEGLEQDPYVIRLRDAFSVEHGLQCGYCTPGMLVTARDIMIRLPDADEARIRLELSGNLCRCTGYVGIVRAIERALEGLRISPINIGPHTVRGLAPVGAHAPAPSSQMIAQQPSRKDHARDDSRLGNELIGLGSRLPSVEIRQSFSVTRPADEVWEALKDVHLVARCLPGAAVNSVKDTGEIEGAFSVRLGPISAEFKGQAVVEYDEANKRGLVRGHGRDRGGRSNTAGEIAYQVGETPSGSRVDLVIKALIGGPLAQFSRGGIVEDLVSSILAEFAGHLQARLSGTAPAPRLGRNVLKLRPLITMMLRRSVQRVVTLLRLK